MKLKNNFDYEELQRWFTFNYTCWWCGQSHANCFHHIDGRSSNSILNAAPMNNFDCHLANHPKLLLKQNKAMLLKKTHTFLMKQGYKLSTKDKEFMEKHKDLYNLQ